MKKIQVTEIYLKNILQALEDAKGYFDMCGIKNTYQKHIRETRKQLDKLYLQDALAEHMVKKIR